MHPRLLLVGAGVAVGALVAPAAEAAPSKTALVIADPKGDANFSGLNGGAAVPASEASMDLTSVTFDTVKKTTTTIVRRRKVVKTEPTHLLVTIATNAAPGTVPSSSYAAYAEHATCGDLLLQVFFPAGPEEPSTYGHFGNCGEVDEFGDTFSIDFVPEIKGSEIIIKVSLKALPKEVKAGAKLTGIGGYTSNSDPVIGYQPTDFEPSAGVDTLTTEKAWSIA